MIVGMWYVQLAAVWHWYLPLCIYIPPPPPFFYFYYFIIVSVHSFLYIFLFSGICKSDLMVDDTSIS